MQLKTKLLNLSKERRETFVERIDLIYRIRQAIRGERAHFRDLQGIYRGKRTITIVRHEAIYPEQ